MTTEESKNPNFTEAEVAQAQEVEFEQQRQADHAYLQNRVLILNIELQRAKLLIEKLESQVRASESKTKTSTA